jgi:hypothetical protein
VKSRQLQQHPLLRLRLLLTDLRSIIWANTPVEEVDLDTERFSDLMDGPFAAPKTLLSAPLVTTS